MVRVEMLRWPADATRRAELAALGVPRLLLVAAGATPPDLDRDEDWIRVPASERDAAARLARLVTLATRRARLPRLTAGLLVYGHRSAQLSEDEAAVVRPLLDRFGELVWWTELVQALWPDGAGARQQAVDRAKRLRRRVEPLGLVLHTVRGVGVVLDHGSPPGTQE